MAEAAPITAYARNYVRRKATAQMTATCRIERVEGPTVDPATLRATSGARTTIYEGRCRVWEVTGGGTFMVGEEEYGLQNTNLSIPWDADPVPRKDDEGVILTSPYDPDMVGRRFQINDTAKAGDLRATRRFQVKMLQENEAWPKRTS